MAWQTVAKGASLSEVRQLIANRELPKGTKIRVVFDAPGFDWVFDMAGAELAFKPFIPKGADLVDVWGENGKGIVEMESDPIWLATVVLGLPVWAWIIIAGITLAIIIAFIVVMVKLPEAARIPFALLIGVAAGIVGLTILGTRYGGKT